MKAVVLLALLFSIPPYVVIGMQDKPLTDKEKVKLRALADNLILTTRGLTSRQEKWELDMAEEFAPLAEFVNSKLKD